jgi:hypothetical protein
MLRAHAHLARQPRAQQAYVLVGVRQRALPRVARLRHLNRQRRPAPRQVVRWHRGRVVLVLLVARDTQGGDA